jgi:transcriptional regulator with XRE-family HTH domain
MGNNIDDHVVAADAPAAIEPADAMAQRLALRLAALRTERGWSLDELAVASGISRATLSRLERGETSPTASLLGKLCVVHGTSMSRLLAGVERQTATLIPYASQPVWVDPASGFRRRMVSPPSREFRMEMAEGTLPAGAVVAYDAPIVHGMELHLWMLEGQLELSLDDMQYCLLLGDCLRVHMHGAARFNCPGPADARYAILVCEP